jgi:hypothetical protein
MEDIGICPYCGAKMKLGFINQDRYSLKWIPGGKDKGPLLQWFPKGIKLTDPFANGNIESFYCEKCEKIIIDTGNKTNQNL